MLLLWKVLWKPELNTDGNDTVRTTSDYDEDTVRNETVGEDTVGEKQWFKNFS
jgi:hypothetical protein